MFQVDYLEWQTLTLELWFPKKWGTTDSKKRPLVKCFSTTKYVAKENESIV